MGEKRIIAEIQDNQLTYPVKIQYLDASNDAEEEMEVPEGFFNIICTRCGEHTPLSESITQLRHGKVDGWKHVETSGTLEIEGRHYYWKSEELHIYCSQQCAVTEEL